MILIILTKSPDSPSTVAIFSSVVVVGVAFRSSNRGGRGSSEQEEQEKKQHQYRAEATLAIAGTRRILVATCINTTESLLGILRREEK